jgi:lipoprotein-anchoring transpeptidase ErfK/SrfK
MAAPPLDVAAVLAADRVHFLETGHTVAGPFWRHWTTRGLDAFGYPISEPFEHGGVLNQYFQRARFELLPDGGVHLGSLGVEAGGAQPPAEDAAAAAAQDPEMELVPETGHTVAGAFLDAYRQMKALLGPPIGPEVATGTGYIQYFTNARLEWDPTLHTRLGLLGTEVAARRGVSTAPVPAPADAVTWNDYVSAMVADEADRTAFASRITGGAPFVPAPGQRWILVSIPQQRITAFEHTRQVFTDLCSTGHRDKGLSTRGVFAINRRVANETMDSTTIGYPRGHPKYYRLENVLYTQYYNGGEAIHYAWWHNNFGQPMSYGCINLRLNTARWFWDWANFNTPIVVV